MPYVRRGISFQAWRTSRYFWSSNGAFAISMFLAGVSSLVCRVYLISQDTSYPAGLDNMTVSCKSHLNKWTQRLTLHTNLEVSVGLQDSTICRDSFIDLRQVCLHHSGFISALPWDKRRNSVSMLTSEVVVLSPNAIKPTPTDVPSIRFRCMLTHASRGKPHTSLIRPSCSTEASY